MFLMNIRTGRTFFESKKHSEKERYYMEESNRNISKKLTTLFDFQKIARNSRLEKVIDETERRCDNALPDSSLEFVSAAGETGIPRKNKENGVNMK